MQNKTISLWDKARCSGIETYYDEIIVSASCFAISRVIYEIAEYVKALIE
jgi:hypothetical protein